MGLRWKTTRILGVQVAGVDRQTLVEQVIAWAEGKETRLVSYVNAYCLNLAARDTHYQQQLNQMDLVYADGIGVVWAGRLLAQQRLYKVTGRAWINEFCRQAQEKRVGIYILAGKPGVAEAARRKLLSEYPGLLLLGAADGYFTEKSEAQVLTELAAHPPQVLFVGMGAVKQEAWLHARAGQIPTCVRWSVGALFDYVAGVEKPVPAWMDRLGFEWLWRLKEDPAGKSRRYLIGIPRFIWRVIRQWLGSM